MKRKCPSTLQESLQYVRAVVLALLSALWLWMRGRRIR